jgi:hypothetical protein
MGCFANEDDTGHTAFVYFSWYGGSHLSSFGWLAESFDRTGYEGSFASKEFLK